MKICLYLKLFFMEYKKILLGFFVAFLICGFVYGAISYIESRKSLVEKFSLGVVVEDESKYLDVLLGIMKEREDLSSILEFKILSEKDAKELLASNKIPCYIFIPKGFVHSIRTGENNNIILVGNKNDAIKYNISEILVKSGVAFLSSSQSGIYSTLDFAYKSDIDENIINDKIVMDINLEFGKELLGYLSYYDQKTVFPTGSLPIKTHYIYSFVTFFILINCIPLYSKLKYILQANIFYRSKALGSNIYKYMFNIFISLFLFVLIFSSPAFFIFGIKTIPIVFCICSFLLFSTVIFKDSTSFANFFFITSIFMLFVSGGILPKVFLPKILSLISPLSINYYVLNINNSMFFSLYLVLYAIILLTVSIIVTKQRTN